MQIVKVNLLVFGGKGQNFGRLGDDDGPDGGSGDNVVGGTNEDLDRKRDRPLDSKGGAGSQCLEFLQAGLILMLVEQAATSLKWGLD